jgi:hypothetical protein
MIGIASLLCGAARLSASTGDPGHNELWTNASLGGGGYLQGLVFSGTAGTLHTYSDVGGVWKSTDSGATWRIVSGGLPTGDGFRNVRGLYVDSSNPARLLAAVGNQWTTNRGIFSSVDGGATWIKRLDARFLGNEEHRSTGGVFATSGSTIFAGSAGDGLWRSTDGGTTWSLVGLQGYNITDVKALAGGGLAVCAAAYTLPSGTVLQGGFFRFGSNLDLSVEGPQGPDEVVEGDGKLVGIFQSASLKSSTDGGANWTDFSTGLPIDEAAAAASYTSESRFRALAVGSGFHLVASSRGTVYRRNFGAAQWSEVTRESVVETFEGRPWWGRIQPGKWQHFGAAAGSLAIDPTNPSRWWMTDWYGLYETTDAGANWTLRIDGIESTVVHCIEGAMGGSRVLAGIADNGPLVSDDNGTTFDAALPFSNLRALARSATRVFGLGSAGGQWQANTVWVSGNSGATWTAAAADGLPQASERFMNSLAATRSGPEILYVAMAGDVSGSGGVYRSTNAGASFEPLKTGMENAGEFFQSSIWSTGSELAINEAGAVVCASRATSQAYRLPPGGMEWQPAMTGLPGQPRDLKAGRTAIHAARGTGGVWTSRDGGANWMKILDGFATALAGDPGDDNHIAALLGDHIVWTADGGQNWNSIPLPPHRDVRVIAFHGGILLAGTNGGGIFRVETGWDSTTPRFASATLTRPSVIFNQPYRRSLVGSAMSPLGSSLIYSKTSGPEWLNLSSGGLLTGIPGPADIGPNIFQIQATDANGASSPATLRIDVLKAPQTIGSFAAPARRPYSSTPIVVSPPVASSGLPVTLSVKSGNATIVNNVLHPLSAGRIVLAANQAGNATIDAAPETTASFVLQKLPQVLTPFSRVSAKHAASPAFSIPTPVASSGLPVVLAVRSGPAVLSGNSVTVTGPGKVVLTANQPGDSIFARAPQVAIAFEVAMAPQAIEILPLFARQNTGRPIPLPSVAASSGLPVTLSVKSGNATIIGDMLHFHSHGPVMLAANQPGDSRWLPAPERVRRITVGEPLAELRVLEPHPVHGSIQPGFAGSTLREQGMPFTIRATPAPGMLFAGWLANGVAASSSSNATFTMQAGLVLEAAFRPRFSALAGKYLGLAGDGTIEGQSAGDIEVFAQRNGFFEIQLGRSGNFTANITVDRTRHTISSTFGNSTAKTLEIPRPGKSPILLDLLLKTSQPSEVSGTIDAGAGAIPFRALLAGWTDSKTRHPLSGKRYRFELDGGSPDGIRYGTLVVYSTGGVSLSVALENGDSPVVSGSVIDSGGPEWVLPFHHLLPSGLIQGEIAIPKNDPDRISGNLEWLGTHIPPSGTTPVPMLWPLEIGKSIDLHPSPVPVQFSTDSLLPLTLRLPEAGTSVSLNGTASGLTLLFDSPAAQLGLRIAIRTNGLIHGRYQMETGSTRVPVTLRGWTFPAGLSPHGLPAEAIGAGHVITPHGSFPFTLLRR